MNRIGMIIPTLGTRPRWLSQCLKSLEMQSYRPLDVLIVGPDLQLLRKLADRHQVGFLPSVPNGLSCAINQGWDALAPECEYLAWLGDDDLLAPGSLSMSVTALNGHPRAAFTFGRTRFIDESSASIYVSTPTSFAPRYMRIGQDYLPQPGSLIRRSAVSWSPVLRTRE